MSKPRTALSIMSLDRVVVGDSTTVCDHLLDAVDALGPGPPQAMIDGVTSVRDADVAGVRLMALRASIVAATSVSEVQIVEREITVLPEHIVLYLRLGQRIFPGIARCLPIISKVGFQGIVIRADSQS